MQLTRFNISLIGQENNKGFDVGFADVFQVKGKPEKMSTLSSNNQARNRHAEYYPLSDRNTL